jgi:hypothetical protein
LWGELVIVTEVKMSSRLRAAFAIPLPGERDDEEGESAEDEEAADDGDACYRADREGLAFFLAAGDEVRLL